MPRRLIMLVAAVVALAAPQMALAAPMDAAANQKIDEAINQHYLATAFKKAETVLLGALDACGDRCSKKVMARAWMYVGIVRGSGKGELPQARKAFEYAVYYDRRVKLDSALATPETKAAFRKAKASGGSRPPSKGGTAAAPSGAAGATAGVAAAGDERSIACTPEVRVIQTRRAIPMQCTNPADAARAEIKYKAVGSDTWRSARMERKGGAFQGTIPCSATMNAGELKVHIVMTDAGGDLVDALASRANPLSFDVVAQTASAPPAFPDQPPPARCEEQVECPPDFPGCHEGGEKKGALGDPCEEADACAEGLVCLGGACEEPVPCDTNEDCGKGQVCSSGSCADKDGPSGPYKRHWFGLHLAFDFTPVGGDDVCSVDSQTQDGYACFNGDTPYAGDQTSGVPGQMGTVPSTIAAATTRLLASYEFAISPNLTLGARAGWAFGGGPDTQNGKSFMPFHGELRASYYLLTLDQKVRPYVHIGGGLAQVDTRIRSVPVRPATAPNQDVALDVWKKAGQSFGTVGGGLVVAFSDSLAAKVNLNLMALFPSSGLSIEPSVGVVYGM